MKQTPQARPFATLRVISNIVVLVALVLAGDWLYAAWHGGGTYACGLATALGSEASLTVIGMGGLVIAIVGISLGGVRHPMTCVGLAITVFGALALALGSDAITNQCL